MSRSIKPERRGRRSDAFWPKPGSATAHAALWSVPVLVLELPIDSAGAVRALRGYTRPAQHGEGLSFVLIIVLPTRGIVVIVVVPCVAIAVLLAACIAEVRAAHAHHVVAAL